MTPGRDTPSSRPSASPSCAAALACAVALACIGASPRPASADTCPAIAGGAPELAAIDAAERGRYIEGVLAREARRGRTWSLAWGWSLTAVSAGQLGVAALTDDPDDRAVWLVSAGKSTLGVIWSFAFDRPEVSVPRTARGCADLAAAEAALVAAARDERIGWLPHAESVALNTAAVLYLSLAHDRLGKALTGSAMAIAVAEFRLYTRPKGAISALRAYRAGRLPPPPAPERASWLIVPRVDADLVGLAVVGSF